MTPEEAIKMLRGMQNKKVDYAEMVCAPAFAYGYQYVYPEPEDYAIEEAISSLKEIQQYREIGTVEECREAVEKQKPKRKIRITSGIFYDLGFRYKCPNCGSGIKTNNIYHYDVCKICGQRIINEESEEE